MSKDVPASVVVFKVALKDRKTIWRRIAVRSDQTLDDLHEAIFAAFDRDDEHLYSFYFPKPGASGRKAIREAAEFSHPMNEDAENAAETTIESLSLHARQSFQYLFDFGDSWWHDIKVESVGGAAEGKYPRVVEKHGKSPPQYPDWDEEE